MTSAWGRNDKTQEEVIASWEAFSLDNRIADPIDISDEALHEMRQRVVRVSTGHATQEEQLYSDEVLAVIAELLRIREGLQPILENKHFVVCAQDEGVPCYCHYWMVKETLDTEDA